MGYSKKEVGAIEVKKKHLIIMFLIILAIVVLIPICINSAYYIGSIEKVNQNTYFSASDMLIYCGTILAFIGTIALGLVSWSQNNNANKINKQLSQEQLIASSKTHIKATDIKLLFTPFEVLIKNESGYCNCLFVGNIPKNDGYYCGLNFALLFKSIDFNYITHVKINVVTIYYEYVGIEDVGTDEHPRYFFSDSDEGGYCNEINFTSKGDKFYSANCMENGLCEIAYYCLVEQTSSIPNKRKINDELENEKRKGIIESILNSERIVIDIEAELINGFNIITKGIFQFKLKNDGDRLVVINKVFIPSGYEYKEG